MIDFMSSIPIDLIVDTGTMSRVAKFSRVGRVYKVIKIIKLFRLFKTMKTKDKISMHFSDSFKLSFGAQRLIVMFITFIILEHIAACLW